MTPTPSETGPGIVVANAPVSYGAFELTVGIDPNVPDGLHVLDGVAAAGLPRTRERFERAAADQRANREYLARRGL